jgi:hypothetical protein
MIAEAPAAGAANNKLPTQSGILKAIRKGVPKTLIAAASPLG